MRHALVPAWIAFVVLSWGTSGGHYWLDSGEIAAAGFELGVVHPPGAPGYGLLLRAAAALPIGSIGYRLALMSALLGAVAVGGVFEILRRRGASTWSCWAAAAWIVCGWTFARQGRVVEIYAFAAAAFVVVLWGFDAVGPSRGRTGRRLVATFCAVWAAWCFGDLRLALVVPVVVGWMVAWRRRRPWARWAPLVVTWACAVALTLPLASARGPRTDWGDPDTARGFWDHVMAVSIRRAYADEILPSSSAMWWHNFNAFVGQLAEDLGPVGPAAVVLALVALWLRLSDGPAARRVAAGLTWLCGIELFYAVAINPMGIVDRQTGAVVAPLAALAVGEALRRALYGRTRLRWAVVPLVWTTLVLPAAVVSARDVQTTRSWMPHAWTRAALADLPPGTLVMAQSDDLAAGLTFAQVVEGARPDVIALVAQQLYKPTPAAAEREPRIAALWEAAHAHDDEAGRIIGALEAHRGPVALEHAGSELFKAVPFWSEHGRLPLRQIGPGTPRAAVAPDAQAIAFVDHWRPRWSGLEDRKRVATTLADDARARVRLTGDLDAGQAILERVLSMVWADHVGTLVTLAAIVDRLGQTEEAIRLSRRALSLEPDRSVALTNLALYLGRDPATLPEALALAEHAARLRPWRTDVWVRLAALREQAGDAAGAAAARAHVRGGPLD